MVTLRSSKPQGCQRINPYRHFFRVKVDLAKPIGMVWRVRVFCSGMTASSRSRTRLSASLARDLSNIFSLAPGTKCIERRNRVRIRDHVFFRIIMAPRRQEQTISPR
ncbi:MAG: hypothetical protein CM1200mP9_04070 [Gammaproteobacteria bacterium]|nr:MAG: hypothetical protein CM1200mP9_04070 [Gammaproteobacteria bacterium]